MPTVFSIRPLFLALAVATVLTACDSAEEQAEKYYQSALSLIEEGDYDRAIVEIRNVFEFDSSHQEARRELAEIMLHKKDNPQAAYQQYLRLAEQYPEDLDARINLSELAFINRNWQEMIRHGTKAQEIEADNARVEIIATALDYRQSVEDEDETARREQSRRAAAQLSDAPESRILRDIITDSHIRDGDIPEALASLEWLIDSNPDNMTYWRQRLNLLAQSNDIEGIEAQLKEMIERFPDNVENRQMLLRFYVSRNRVDEAEAFLRETAANSDDPRTRGDLVNFLLQTRGTDVALQELERVIAEEEDPVPFEVVRATINFSTGAQDEAVLALENILDGAESTTETMQAARIALAKMLATMGNEVGAQQRVKEVLAEDATNPEALKMQAAWQIESDDTDAAINGLRLALDRAPDDAQAMVLMAQAYTRAGSTELAREFLSLAVEASGNAPAETLRYVSVLIGDESYLAAEDLLKKALRLAPRNTELLGVTGQLYLLMDDPGRAAQVIRTLQQIDEPRAQQLAQQLEAERLNRELGAEEALAYLGDLAASDTTDNSNRINLVRAQLATGNTEEALAQTQELIAADPTNADLRGLLAVVHEANGNLDDAATIYRDLLTENAARTGAWLRLARLVRIREDAEAAEAVINDGLNANPEAANLLVASASFKETDGDIDGAIKIYEDLYTRNSGSILVANNLASLLATYRSDDAASVERAWSVARRLRDMEIPALQDTYGWILHLRGESSEALPYLEAAAAGLGNDPIVQFHLAEIYSALERPQEALAQYRVAVEVAGPADQRDQIERARAQITELQTATEAVQSQDSEN